MFACQRPDCLLQAGRNFVLHQVFRCIGVGCCRHLAGEVQRDAHHAELGGRAPDPGDCVCIGGGGLFLWTNPVQLVHATQVSAKSDVVSSSALFSRCLSSIVVVVRKCECVS